MRVHLVFLLFVTTIIGAAQQVSSDPVGAFFNQSQIKPLHSYKGTQKFEVVGTGKNGKKQTGWIETSVELSANGEFSSNITKRGGSKLVTTYLEMFVVGKRPNVIRSDFTDANYEITFNDVVREDNSTLIRLRLKPKRKEIYLTDGFIFIRSDGEHYGDMVKTDGQAAKNPLFTNSGHVTRFYDRIMGTRVPVKMVLVASISVPFVVSNASVNLVATYSYSEINGEKIK